MQVRKKTRQLSEMENYDEAVLVDRLQSNRKQPFKATTWEIPLAKHINDTGG